MNCQPADRMVWCFSKRQRCNARKGEARRVMRLHMRMMMGKPTMCAAESAQQCFTALH